MNNSFLARGIPLLLSIFAIVGFIFWVIMLIDCLKRNFTNPKEKTVWVLLLIFLNIIAVSYYYYKFYKKPK